jgi:hypothetical protein
MVRYTRSTWYLEKMSFISGIGFLQWALYCQLVESFCGCDYDWMKGPQWIDKCQTVPVKVHPAPQRWTRSSHLARSPLYYYWLLSSTSLDH